MTARERESAERALAEAYAAGAVGCEEREDADGFTWLLYAPRAAADAVRAAALRAAGDDVTVAPPRVLPDTDWSEAWKAELAPIEISERLAVRPSFTRFTAGAGQQVLVVDPGQAFGTGAHESTRLALEWVADRAPALPAHARVLDVGTGSGVLALAALALAPVRAFAFDLDPLAAPEAQANAVRNALDRHFLAWTGPLESLSPAARFELVLANLLRRELEPILTGLAARLADGGELVLSGLLAEERAGVEAQARSAGLAPAGRRERADASGARWASLLMRKPRAPASPPAPAGA